MERVSVLIGLAVATSLLSGCVVGGNDAADAPTVAAFTVSLADPSTFTFRFDASRSTGPISTYEWSFGDGERDEGKTVEHAFRHGDGVYKVTLEITDKSGVTAQAVEQVTVGTGINAAPTAFFIPSARIAKTGEELRFDASTSSDPDGDPLRYKWNFNYLIDETDYYQFKDAKANLANEDADGGGNDVSVMSASRFAAPDLPDLTIPNVGFHGGGDGSGGAEPRNYMLEAEQITETSVINFTFDTAAHYYVHLAVMDVKGKFELIRSEEIWVLAVRDAPPADVFSDTKQGNMTVGPAGHNDKLSEEDLAAANYSDEATYEYSFAYPLKSYRVRITWTTGALDTAYRNDINANITHPVDDRVRASPDGNDPGNEIVLTETNREFPLNKGSYTLRLKAVTGLGIPDSGEQEFRYTIVFEAQLDTNPFADDEADIPAYGPY